MTSLTDDLRIREIKELATPADVMRDCPPSEAAIAAVASSRHALHRILHGQDDRLAVVIGPCSIHDPVAALEYAKRLVAERERHADALEIVMRVYFEKPRTTVGWKGLINDPDLDESYHIDKGLHLARSLLCDINALGLPAGFPSSWLIAVMISGRWVGRESSSALVSRRVRDACSIQVRSTDASAFAKAAMAMAAAIRAA